MKNKLAKNTVCEGTAILLEPFQKGSQISEKLDCKKQLTRIKNVVQVSMYAVSSTSSMDTSEK